MLSTTLYIVIIYIATIWSTVASFFVLLLRFRSQRYTSMLTKRSFYSENRAIFLLGLCPVESFDELLNASIIIPLAMFSVFSTFYLVSLLALVDFAYSADNALEAILVVASMLFILSFSVFVYNDFKPE